MRLDVQSMEPSQDRLVRAVCARVRKVVTWTVKARRAGADSTSTSAVIHIENGPPVIPFDGGITVAMTARHLEIPGLAHPFGYAFPEERVAVVSTIGLVPQPYRARLMEERLCKEVVHEAGHVLGLPHCMNETCVMHYSQALQDTDAKGCSFCPQCALELSKLPGIGREA
jgi:predicted Zn-dependent protease